MIRVQQVSHADAHVAIHDVRQRVFVQEQGIAAELERDALSRSWAAGCGAATTPST